MEDLAFCLDISKCVFVDVFSLIARLDFGLLLLWVVLVEQWIFEVRDRDSISLEEPLFELLNEGCFERGDILVEFNDFVSEGFDFLQLYLVIPLADLLLFDELELLFVDDIFSQFLWRLALFL